MHHSNSISELSKTEVLMLANFSETMKRGKWSQSGFPGRCPTHVRSDDLGVTAGSGSGGSSDAGRETAALL